MTFAQIRRRLKGRGNSRILLGMFLALGLGLFGCQDEPTILTFPEEANLNWVRYAWQGVEPLSSESGNGAVEQSFELDGKKGGEFNFRKVTLDFPPRAVSGQHTLTIQQPDPRTGIWSFTLEPGTSFERPVTLTIDYAGFSNAGDHTILWLDEKSHTWVDIGGKDYPSKGYCTVDLTHFSTYGVTDGTAGWE